MVPELSDGWRQCLWMGTSATHSWGQGLHLPLVFSTVTRISNQRTNDEHWKEVRGKGVLLRCPMSGCLLSGNKEDRWQAGIVMNRDVNI